MWRREEDIQHDIYRPVYRDVIAATLQERAGSSAWKYQVTGSSVIARWLPPAFQKGIDGDAIDSAPLTSPTTFPNVRIHTCASSLPP